MNPESNDKELNEKKWMSIKDWKSQKAPYFKKNPGIEGMIALEWAKKAIAKGKVLDIGCGAGRNSILFAKNGFKVIGIDFSKTAIKLANILRQEEKSKADFKVQSALNLTFKENYFDLIMDFGCFHHLRKNQWSKYEMQVLRALKPKAHFILYCFSKESKETGNYSKGKDYSIRNKAYNRYFSQKDLQEIFGKRFKIIKKKTIKEKGRLLAFNLALMQRI
ncbi:MAG: methyltransferase domain-containing protein [Candidatus Nanoarchaeia archaeon]|nr:methyltransferase domain-containing protein [Candidatus Nanoarchaeia archaeon]